MIAANILSADEVREEKLATASHLAAADLAQALKSCNLDQEISTPGYKRQATAMAGSIVSDWIGDGPPEVSEMRILELVKVLVMSNSASDLSIRTRASALIDQIAEWHGAGQAEDIVARDESEAAEDAADDREPTTSWGRTTPAGYMDLADRRAA